MAISPIINKPVAGQAPAITPLPVTPVAQAPVSTNPIGTVHTAQPTATTTEVQNQQILAQNQAKRQAMAQAGEIPAVGEQATPEQTYTPPTPVIKQNNPITTQENITPVAPVVGAPIVPKTTAAVTPPAPVRPPSQSVIQGQSPIDGKTMEERLANITASYDEGFKAYDAQVADYDNKMAELQKTINDPIATANDKALAQQNLNAYSEAKQQAIMNRTKQEANLNTEIDNEKATSLKEEMDARNLNAFKRDYDTQMKQLADDKEKEVARLATQGQQQIDDQARQNAKDATSLQILGNAVIGGGHMGGQDSGISQGIIDELNYGKTILDRVKQNADWQMTDLVEEFNRSTTDLHNKYVDSIPQATQDLLTSISSLDQAGRLKTIQDWEAAKRSLAPIINKIQVAQTAKLDAIKSNNALFEKKLEQLKNSKKIDDGLSQQNGYFMNANGEPMLGQDGKPMVYQSNAIQSTSMNDKTGEMTILYQDGRFKTVKVQNPTLTQEWKESTTMPGYMWNPATGEYKQAGTGGGVTGTTDFRQLAYKYPNEASMKNNNPAGITWNSNFDNGTGFSAVLKANGVNFTKGTDRPAAEGGAYVSFPTVQDGLNAYSLLWQQPQYQGMRVQDALNKWGTGALDLGPINPDMTVGQLNQQQLQTLQMKQLQKESPGFFKELNAMQQQQQTSTAVSPAAQSYVDLYNKGTMDLETILTKIGSSKAALPLKNEVVAAIQAQGGKIVRPANDPQVLKLKDTLDNIKFLKENEFMDTAVGANTLGRTSLSNWYSGGKDDYLAAARNLISGKTLQELIDAKAQGATFGALSNDELLLLKDSSSKLTARATYDSEGKIVGFKGTEEAFKKDLDKLAEQTQRAIDLMTGGTSTIAPTTPTEQPKTTVSQADIDAAKARAKALLTK